MTDGSSVGGSFIAIPVTTLRVHEVVGFDLYLPRPATGVPVLYRKRSLPLDDDVRKRLDSQKLMGTNDPGMG